MASTKPPDSHPHQPRSVGGEKIALSETQTFGLSDTVQKLFREKRNLLVEAGLDVDSMLRQMAGDHEEATKANAEQEDAKLNARQKTERFVAAKRKLYVTISSCLDMAIAGVRKDSLAAKNFRRLRSRIRRPDIEEKVARDPTPEATA